VPAAQTIPRLATFAGVVERYRAVTEPFERYEMVVVVVAGSCIGHG